MKFGQLIEHSQRKIFFKNYAKNEGGELVPGRFLFFKEALYQVKASGLQLFRQPSNQHTIETNCLKLHTIDPEIRSILFFQIRVWEQSPQCILCMIYTYSSRYILVTYQISLPGYFYILSYWAMYVLQLFVNQVVMSWILKLIFSF